MRATIRARFRKLEIDVLGISGGEGTAADKIRALVAASVKVAPSPAEMGTTLQSMLKG